MDLAASTHLLGTTQGARKHRKGAEELVRWRRINEGPVCPCEEVRRMAEASSASTVRMLVYLPSEVAGKLSFQDVLLPPSDCVKPLCPSCMCDFRNSQAAKSDKDARSTSLAHHRS